MKATWFEKSEGTLKFIKNESSLTNIKESKRLIDKSHHIPPPMPLIPWSLIPIEPVWSGAGI